MVGEPRRRATIATGTVVDIHNKKKKMEQLQRCVPVLMISKIRALTFDRVLYHGIVSVRVPADLAK